MFYGCTLAQNLYAAFGLGEDDKHVRTIDADGVAPAAIQALHEIIEEPECPIEVPRSEKDTQVAALEKQNGKPGTRLAALEQSVGQLARKREGDVR